MDIYQKYYNEDNNNRPYTDFFIETCGADYMEHQAGRFACRTGKGANEGKFIIQSKFKKANIYYSYGMYFYVHNIKATEKTVKNKDGKQPKYEIDLYTFANIYPYGNNKKKFNGYNEKVYKTNILNKDKVLTLPKAVDLENAIMENIEKAKAQVELSN